MTRERFIILVTKEQEPLRRFLLTLCGGERVVADDVAQEAFIKAWLHIEHFDERYSFRTWLYKIAYRTLIDHLKRPHLERLTTASEQAPANTPADAQFHYEELYHAIAQLPESMRAAVVLYHLQGYSMAEIATITGANPIAVRQRLSRGLRQLRKILNP